MGHFVKNLPKRPSLPGALVAQWSERPAIRLPHTRQQVKISRRPTKQSASKQLPLEEKFGKRPGQLFRFQRNGKQRPLWPLQDFI